MNAALGPFAIAAGLLAIAGVLKAWKPHDTTVALRGVGIPASDWQLRVVGVLEAGLGVVALFVATPVVASLVAVSYVLFAAFVALALHRDLPIASCGCFGRVDSPPSRVHLGVNLGAAAAAIVVAADPGLAPFDLVVRAPLEGAAYSLLVVVGVAAAGLAVTALPRVLAFARQESTT